jgi:hypothetical protein
VSELRILRERVKPAILTRAWQRIQERIREPALRKQLARIAGIPKGAPVLPADPAAFAQLQRDGIVQFPGFLSPEEVQQLRAALEPLDCFDAWSSGSATFRVEAVPPGTHIGQIPAAPALEKLHRIALDPRLLGLAGAYFGCKPTLDCILAWWSFSGNDAAQDAELFHRDNDSLRFLKLFVYLTDVGQENGPHVFVRGSHTSRKLLARRRLTDEEVGAAFAPQEVATMTGRAGDAFIEDTYGIHKGQLPMSGTRLLVQVRYSVCESVWRSPVITAKPEFFDPRAAHSLVYGT